MLRSAILAASGSDLIRRMIVTAPGTRSVVRRFVAGESLDEAVAVATTLASDGLCSTLDFLGEEVTDPDGAERTVLAYLALLDRLHAERLSDRVEVSLKLSAVGQSVDGSLALTNASRVCAAAEQAGTTVTLDAEGHATTDSTLEILGELRRSWPATGAVLQSQLHRCEKDCRALAGTGSRVRLCKGAYVEPDSVAFGDPHDVARSYVRCANLLLEGDGYPMFATHDPRLVAIVTERAGWYGREPGTFEYQMLYGVRPDEQRRLAAEGATVRIYVPYGSDWYRYLMRRLAERPANLALFLRALASTR